MLALQQRSVVAAFSSRLPSAYGLACYCASSHTNQAERSSPLAETISIMSRHAGLGGDTASEYAKIYTDTDIAI